MEKNKLHYGIVVGINRYPGIRHLRKARGDAIKFAEWLTDEAGGNLPPGNVVLIVVDDAAVPDGLPVGKARPVKSEIRDAFRNFRKAVEMHVDAHPDDWKRTRFYFYVSGHGIAPDTRDAALLMADASSEDYNENISCGRLLSFLRERQPFREVVIFADCCRERVDSNVEMGTAWGTLPGKENGNVVRAFCCAAYFGDLAYEPPPNEDADQQRSYLTQALLEGLRGEAADPPGYGEINSNTLAKYVRQRVRDLTKGRKQQTPEMESDPAEPIVFQPASAQSPAAVKHEVRIEFVTPYQGKVALRDNDNNILRKHQTADGDLVVSLANSLYEVTAEDGGVEFNKGGRFRVLGDKLHVQL